MSCLVTWSRQTSAILFPAVAYLQQPEGARRQQGVIQGGSRFGILALPGDHVDPGPFLHRHQPFHFQA